MKRALQKCGICFFMSLLFIICSGLFNVHLLELPLNKQGSFHSGFAVHAAVNPVSFLITETQEGFLAEIVLEEHLQMQAFQMRLCFDGKKLTIQSQESYYQPAFLQRYNANQAALLNHNLLNQGKRSSLILLGLQTDEDCAAVNKGTTLAAASFQYALADADVAERAEALETVYLQVEVLEGKEGNLVQGQEAWRIKPVFKNQQIKEPANDETTQNNESNDRQGSDENQENTNQNHVQDDIGNENQNNDYVMQQDGQNNKQNSILDYAHSQGQESSSDQGQEDLQQRTPQQLDQQTENKGAPIENNAKENTGKSITATDHAQSQKNKASDKRGLRENKPVKVSWIWIVSISIMLFCAVGVYFAVRRRKKS